MQVAAPSTSPGTTSATTSHLSTTPTALSTIARSAARLVVPLVRRGSCSTATTFRSRAWMHPGPLSTSTTQSLVMVASSRARELMERDQAITTDSAGAHCCITWMTLMLLLTAVAVSRRPIRKIPQRLRLSLILRQPPRFLRCRLLRLFHHRPLRLFPRRRLR